MHEQIPPETVTPLENEFTLDDTRKDAHPPKNFRQRIPKIKTLAGVGLVFVLSVLSLASVQLVIRQRGPERSQASTQGLETMNVLLVTYAPSNSPHISKAPALTQELKLLIQNGTRYHGSSAAGTAVNISPIYFYRPNVREAKTEAYSTTKAILLDKSGGVGATNKSPCEVIGEQDIDQVWLWVDPSVDFAPGLEHIAYAARSNSGINSPCDHDKGFVVMGLDSAREPAQALHSFGHYVESLMSSMFGSTFLDAFTGVKPAADTANVDGADIPGILLSDRCGSVHIPPNAIKHPEDDTGTPYDERNYYIGYRYDGANTVLSGCENWNPEGTGAKLPTSKVNWENLALPAGVTPDIQTKYLTWWMQQIPGANNTVTVAATGQRIPSLWDFLVDREDTISYYMDDGRYLLDSRLTRPDAFTFSKGSSSSNDVTWTQKGSNTLGVSVPETSEVLADVAYVPMALVTAALNSTNTGADGQWIANVTFCGQLMTEIATKKFISSTRTQGVGMWYLLNPPTGDCPIKATFGKTGGYGNIYVFSSTIFKSVNPINPITEPETRTSSVLSDTLASVIPAIKTGPKDTVLACTYSAMAIHTTSNDSVFPKDTKSQYWSRSANQNYAIAGIISGLGVSDQRRVDGESKDVGWETNKTFPWSTACANIKVKPLVLPTPPPVTPPPVTATPKPTPCNAPLLPRVSSVSRTTTGISWNAVSGAKAYQVFLNDTSTPWHPSTCQVGDTCGIFTTQTSHPFSIAASKTYEYMVLPVNECGNTVTPLPTLVANLYSSQTTNGFAARYFPNTTFTVDNSGLFASRTDQTINVNWGSTLLSSMIMQSNKFSVRWGANLIAPVTGTYTFEITSRNGIKLSVNNKLLINKLTNTATVQVSKGTISLTKGVAYAFKLEYSNTSSNPQIAVRWRYPGKSLQIIPSTVVTPNIQLTF